MGPIHFLRTALARSKVYTTNLRPFVSSSRLCVILSAFALIRSDFALPIRPQTVYNTGIKRGSVLSQPHEPAPEAVSFEDSLHELERTVELLEEGALPLEESLSLFEKGVAALKRCHNLLDRAEKRVKVLVRNARGEVSAQELSAAPAAAEPAPAPVAAPAKKKSGGQPVDSKGVNRQNAAPLQVQAPDAAQADSSPGGSLFGG